ncbi:hypothetical protein ABK040_009251 [Willaertia magna]
MGNTNPVQTLFLGADGSGKTTIIKTAENKFKPLKQDQLKEIRSTTGHEVRHFKVGSVSFAAWDLPGKEQLRSVWNSYYKHAEALVFVVDSTGNEDNLEEVKEILHGVIQNVQLRECTLLILANKQDATAAKKADELKEFFNLSSLAGLRDRTWRLQGCSSLTGDGLEQAFLWLSDELKKQEKEKEKKRKEQK